MIPTADPSLAPGTAHVPIELFHRCEGLMKHRRFTCFVFLVLPLLGLQPGLSQGQVPVEVGIELTPKIIEGESLGGSIVFRPLSGGGEPVSLPVKGARQMTISLPAETAWEVEPRIERYWALPSPIRSGRPGERLAYKLNLWPESRVTGTIAAEHGEKLPSELAVKIRAARIPGRKPDVPEVIVKCPVGKLGELSCELPATLLDLSIQAEGFVPHNRWAVRLERDKALPLGRLVLKKGASVSGWAQVEDGVIDPANAKARLFPLQAPGGDPSLAERLRSTAPEVPLDERGFFQFAAVTPGSYVVEVTQPGFAPARVSPIEVWPGSETSLTQPLTLRRPLRIELIISPEMDWLGKPWTIEMFRASDLGGSSASVYDGAARRDGRVILEGQTPGTFRVVVSDSLGNPLYSDFDFVIRDAVEAQREIEIDLVSLQGEVLLGDEPLSAMLYFGGRHAALGSRMESDQDGEFHGVLPREGTWLVEVDSTEPALSTHSRVQIRARRDGTARLTLRIPDTRIFGKVVAEEGRPEKATVFAESGEGAVEAATRDDGSFEIRGLPAGPVRLSAEAGSREGRLVSDSILTVLGEENQVGPVELRLRKNKLVQGRVLSARGPVPGAVLEVFPLRPALPGGASARTDLQGSFEARVPELTETLLAIVSPPGHGLKAFEVPFDGSPAVLEVSREAGTLEISAGISEEEARAQALQMVIVQNGLHLPWNLLLHWAQGHGERLRVSEGFRIPHLSPGEYRACLVSRGELVQRGPDGPNGLGGQCASGYLEAGGTLRLDLARH